MGFPAGYSEFPGLLLHAIFLLGHVRRLIYLAFDSVGLGDLLDSDDPWPNPSSDLRHHHPHNHYRYITHHPELHAVPASLIDEILPVVRYNTLDRSGDSPDFCAVCLHELEGREEVRRLSNCRHVFHMRCLDRLIGHRQITCPLCRAPLFPPESPATSAATTTTVDGGFDWFYDDEYYSLTTQLASS